MRPATAQSGRWPVAVLDNLRLDKRPLTSKRFVNKGATLIFVKSTVLVCLALAFCVNTHVNAAVVTASDFQVQESPGQFTVINNSTDWYVERLIVQDAAASSGTPTTTQSGWSASVIGNSFFPASGFSPAFNYFNPSSGIPGDIGPLSSSGEFFFTTPAQIGSAWELYLANTTNSDTETLYGVTAKRFTV
jgi:hypothetical protein